MLKILDAQQIKAIDAATIIREPITSIDLMERASNAIVTHLCDTISKSNPIYIFCGYGNNGGDGLAIARLLLASNYRVHTYYIEGNYSNDCLINLERLSNKQKIKTEKDFPIIPATAIVIDALFGSGINKPLQGTAKALIDYLNQHQGLKIAIDVPSGLQLQQNSRGAVFNADKVYTFYAPKLAFLLPQNFIHSKSFFILDIGLNEEAIIHATTTYFYIEIEDIRARLHQKSKYIHKGDNGHCLLIVGSKGKAGASILAAKSCLRSGTGLLSLLVPEYNIPILQVSAPEAMCLTDTAFPNTISLYQSIGIGCGIGLASNSLAILEQVIATATCPIVLDADAITLLAQNRILLEQLPRNSVLTPHPKEFERLVGKWNDDFERLEKLKIFAIQHQVIVVLKGAHTAICNSDGIVFFNSTGNPGMATGGTGDVLTGIIAGLLSQNYQPIDAAIIGVFLHGLAADLALQQQSYESLIASDIIDYLGRAYTYTRI